MAESADKTPAGESKLDDDSDVIELTDEVSAIPDNDSHSGDDGDEADADSGEDASGELGSSDDDHGDQYDRQEMVKTVQMDAVDRDAIEQMVDESAIEAASLLENAGFAPEIIPSPPAVLVKKWREGIPGKVELIIGTDKAVGKPSEPEQLDDAPAPDKPGGPEGVDEPAEQTDPPDADDEVEPIELDDELVELEEDDGPARTVSPPQQPEREPKSTPPASTPERPEKSAESSDDEQMPGLVRELLEEEKQKKEEAKLGPRQIWFKKVFDEEYLRSIPDGIAEITRRESDFIEESLRLKKNSRILDLACGFGRHSIELAQRGYQMVGLDLSMPLLQRAVDAAQQRSLNVKFIHSDMRELDFSQIFDGAFVWNTSLGYFDDRTNLEVLHGLHRALKVGGRLVVDVLNRDHVIQQTPTRLWWEGNGCIFLEETEFDYQTSTLQAERSYIYEDGKPPVEHTSFIRLYSVHELRQMLHVAGFRVLEVSGEYHHRGYFLGPASRRIIVLAEKRKKRRNTARGRPSVPKKK